MRKSVQDQIMRDVAAKAGDGEYAVDVNTLHNQQRELQGGGDSERFHLRTDEHERVVSFEDGFFVSQPAIDLVDLLIENPSYKVLSKKIVAGLLND